MSKNALDYLNSVGFIILILGILLPGSLWVRPYVFFKSLYWERISGPKRKNQHKSTWLSHFTYWWDYDITFQWRNQMKNRPLSVFHTAPARSDLWAKPKGNHKNKIKSSKTSCFILKVNKNFIFVSLISPIGF